MNIDKVDHDHIEILHYIDQLRLLIGAGIAHNAPSIAGLIVAMSSSIKLHLAVEDRVVYPALANSGDFAQRYMVFVRRWNTAAHVAQAPQTFRTEANAIFKTLFERTRREANELYPAFAAIQALTA
jgi:hypothetical protein